MKNTLGIDATEAREISESSYNKKLERELIAVEVAINKAAHNSKSHVIYYEKLSRDAEICITDPNKGFKLEHVNKPNQSYYVIRW